MKKWMLLIVVSFSALALLSACGTPEKEKEKPKSDPYLSYHTSPLPSYMAVVVMHEKDLNLTAEQKKSLLDGWQKEHGPVVGKQKKEIVAGEVKLRTMSLDGVAKEEILKEYKKIEGIRDSIVDTKVKCRDNLKSVLDKKQYETVIKMYKEHFLSKHKVTEAMKADHTSPLPSYMMVVGMHEKDLNLTAEQKKSLFDGWQKKHMPVVGKQKEEIIKGEEKLRTMSIEGVSAAEILKEYNKIKEIRSKIVHTKMECRDNLKSVLDKKQYETVIKMYKEHFLSKHGAPHDHAKDH